MIIEEKGVLLTAESKPYEFEGRSGVSSKIRVLIEDSIFPLKANEELVERFKNVQGSKGTVKFNLTSRKENVSLEFLDFITTK